eukprot:6183032-Pleurochrysis_carterae.AAC.1
MRANRAHARNAHARARARAVRARTCERRCRGWRGGALHTQQFRRSSRHTRSRGAAASGGAHASLTQFCISTPSAEVKRRQPAAAGTHEPPPSPLDGSAAVTVYDCSAC